MMAIGTALQHPEKIEQYLGDGWTKGSGVKLSLFEALAWIRYEDIVEYIGFRTEHINHYDTQYTYDEAVYQDWVSDEQGGFDFYRYASGVYNIPIRLVTKLQFLSKDKHEAAQKAIEYIEEYKATVIKK
jgi:hypothetical protein